MNITKALVASAIILTGITAYRIYKRQIKTDKTAALTITLPIQNTVTFVPKLEKDCAGGELDYIKEIHNITGELLLTIEPLPGSRSFTPIVKKIQVMDLFNAERVKLDLSSIDKNKNYDMGVWICSDRTRQGRCSGKKSFDYDDANEQIRQTGRLDTRGKDQIYYFQYMNLRERKASLLDISQMSEKDLSPSIAAMVAAKGRDLSSARKLHDFVKKNVVYIGSRGVGINQSDRNFQIYANFAKRDEKKCSPEAYANEFFKIVKPNTQTKKAKPKWRTLPKFSRQ